MTTRTPDEVRAEMQEVQSEIDRHFWTFTMGKGGWTTPPELFDWRRALEEELYAAMRDES
jgi:hypothetical protein